MKYYQFNLGDYAEKTKHLTWDEDAAYRKLLDMYYSAEFPLPLDRRKIYRQIGADSEDRRAACDAVIDEFFIETEEGFRHSKCDEKIAEIYTKSKLAAKAGKASAATRAAKKPTDVEKKPTDVEKKPTDVEKKPTDVDLKPGCESQKQPSRFNDENGRIPTDVEKKATDVQRTLKKTQRPLEKIQLPTTQYLKKELLNNTNTFNNLPARDPAPPDRFDDVDLRLRKIPGISKHPVATAPTIEAIWQLILQGVDFDNVIIPSIKQQLKTAKRSISGWGYFKPGILQFAKTATSVPKGFDEDTWKRKLDFARENRVWSESVWGPLPGRSGCRVPSSLLMPDDGQGWKIDRVAS